MRIHPVRARLRATLAARRRSGRAEGAEAAKSAAAKSAESAATESAERAAPALAGRRQRAEALGSARSEGALHGGEEVRAALRVLLARLEALQVDAAESPEAPSARTSGGGSSRHAGEARRQIAGALREARLRGEARPHLRAALLLGACKAPDDASGVCSKAGDRGKTGWPASLDIPASSLGEPRPASVPGGVPTLAS